MFCKHCGYKLPDNTNFCTECGKITEEPRENGVVDVTKQPSDAMRLNTTGFEDPFKIEKDTHGGRILTFAIIALAFSFTIYLSWIGLAFAIVALVKVKKYTSRYGFTDGRASVGKGLGIGALVLNIASFASLILTLINFILNLIEGSLGAGSGGSGDGFIM